METIQGFKHGAALSVEVTPLINKRVVDNHADNGIQNNCLLIERLNLNIRGYWPYACPFLIMMHLLIWLFWHQSDFLRPSIYSQVIQSPCHEGEVWLIRHGEKNTTDRTNVTALYDLSTRGWERAFYLKKLVESALWPNFSAVFATAYASDIEIADAYPQLVRTKLGQSMVRREYQTVAPLAEDTLGLVVNTTFTKDDFSGVALAATRAALATCGVPVLISWDHCSLPALVKSGFGCDQIECRRCWPDLQYDEVMKLAVKIGSDDSDKPVLTSRVISMMREHGKISDESSFEANSNDRNWAPSRDLLQDSVDIRQTTFCQPSYCSDREVARTFEKCVCFDVNISDWKVL